MATMADCYYFADSFDRNMKTMYEEAKKLLELSDEEFPEGTGVLILTEDPADFKDIDPHAYEVLEQTMSLSDEEPYNSDDDTKDEHTHRQETSSQAFQQQSEDDDIIARALRQLTEAKEKAAEVVVDDKVFPTSSGHRDQLASELDDHLEHTTRGVQMAIDEFGQPTQKLSRDKELPHQDVQ